MPLAPRPPEAPVPDLPELDKSEDSDEVDVGVFELDMGGDADSGEESDALDAFEVDIQEQIDAGSSEAAGDLDIGEASLIDALPEAPAPREGDELPPASTEIDWQLDAPLVADEANAEIELGDDGLESLPELLAEDGDADSGPELERALLSAAPEGAIPQGPSFEAEWILLGSACTALWTNGDEVLACAEQLMHFGPERSSLPLPSGTRVAAVTRLSTGAVVLATARGLLELSPSGACSVPEPPDALRGSGAGVAELGSTAGAHDLWARLVSGLLLRRRSGVWERYDSGVSVRSLTSSSDHLTLLVVADRPTLQLSSDAGSSFREQLLPEPAATVALGAAPAALGLGRTLALFDAERGLCVSDDAGGTFHMVTGGVNVTAVALGQHAGAPAVFAALYREGRDVTELILVDPSDGRAYSIAELSGEADEDAEETGRSHALIYADGYLWAAGGYGLAKLKAA